MARREVLEPRKHSFELTRAYLGARDTNPEEADEIMEKCFRGEMEAEEALRRLRELLRAQAKTELGKTHMGMCLEP